MSSVEHRIVTDDNSSRATKFYFIRYLINIFIIYKNRYCIFRQRINNIGTIILEIDPRGPAAGLARSLLALGTFLTILATPQDKLLFRSEQYPDGVVCGEIAEKISLYCIFKSESFELYIITLMILLAVIIGLFPIITSWLHAWLSCYFVRSVPILDGGDQVAQALTFLFVIFHLGDTRITHWHRRSILTRGDKIFSPVRAAAVFLFAIQGSVIYLHASIAKLSIPEWVNGTAIWYWVQDPTSAPPNWLCVPLESLLSYAPTAIIITYGILSFEFILGISVFFPANTRRLFLFPGLVLHIVFAMVFGLWSFLLSMSALLIMYTRVSSFYRL